MAPERKDGKMNINNKTMRLSVNALLLALLVLLGMTPFGLIPLGFINITVLCIPVIVATLSLGRLSGLILGIGFGTVSTLSMLGFSLVPPSALASSLFTRAPFYALLMCYVPRILMPLLLSMMHEKNLFKANHAVLAFLASFINTVLYLGLMLLFYQISALDAGRILKLIFGTGIIAGTMEAIAAALLVPVIVKILNKFIAKDR